MHILVVTRLDILLGNENHVKLRPFIYPSYITAGFILVIDDTETSEGIYLIPIAGLLCCKERSTQIIEDNGSLISFCFWCPNTQEGWTIDYATGNAVNDAEAGADDYWDSAWKDEYQTYIINTKSKKFHLPDGCNGLPSEENSELVEDTYNNLIAQGYSPCGNCFK